LHREGNVWNIAIKNADKATMFPIIKDSIGKDVRIISDSSPIYGELYQDYKHKTINHYIDVNLK
jgi:hypothetical protein